MHRAAGLLDNVNRLEVTAALQAEDGVDGNARKVILVLCQDLGAQCGFGDIEEVLLELFCIAA